MEPIKSAVGSIDAKKENLRKAFEQLQSFSPALSSFTLQWKDLEDHFESIRKSIEERMKELESKEKEKEKTDTPPATATATAAKKEKESHPEIRSFSVKMDGPGLRSYILKHRKDLASIRDEVGLGLRSASDPAKLVLDAMEGFYPSNSKGDKDNELAAFRRTCLLLLEQLILVSPKITPETKERAQKLAKEWKAKVSPGGDNPLEPLALLQLLASYAIVSTLPVNEVLDLAVLVARRKQAVDLIRSLSITDKIPDFIEKLTSKGKQLEAVKFVYAFELVDKFAPVPLLKEYFTQSKKVAEEIRKKGNLSVQSQNEATAKELAAMRAIIKCIEEHNLESEYPRAPLEKRIEHLEKQRADKKRPASGPVPADRNQHQHPGNKRQRPMGMRPTSSTTPSNAMNHLQPMNSVVDRFSPYMSSAAQYGLVGVNPTVPSYMTSAAGPYGLGSNPASSYSLGETPSSYGMNHSPSRPHLYSSESHLAAGLYDRPMSYGGHGVPPSHRSLYYP